MVREIYEHWVAVMQFPRKRALTKDRRLRILSRLREGYTVRQLREVATKASQVPFWRGVNRWNKPFDDIINIYKHAQRVDMFLDLCNSETNQEAMMATDGDPEGFEL